MKRVLAFGAFDPINNAHKDFLRQAKAMGDHLTVVVAHESAIRAHKGREAVKTEEQRLAAVRDLGIADEVILGRKTANKYHILQELNFDVLALGYGQKPSDEEVRHELDEIGKQRVEIVRCREYVFPESLGWVRIVKIVAAILVVIAILVIAFRALQVQGT